MANTLDIKLLLSDDGSIGNVQSKLADAFKKAEATAQSSAEKSKSAWDRVSKSIKDHADVIDKLGKGFAVVGGGISAFMGLAVHEAAKSEASNLKLQQSIRLAGLEMESASKTIQSFAGSMQGLTGVSDELIQDFVGRMLPITGSVAKAMDAARIAMDFAAGTGRDLQSVEQVMTQVLAGNIEILRRAVPALKNLTTEQLENMTASQRTAIALEAMRKQFGGMAQIEGRSAAGQLRVLKETVGDLMETIGGVLLPLLVPLAQTLKNIAVSAAEWMKEHKALSSVLVTSTAVIGGLMLGLSPLLLAIPKLTASIGFLIPAFQGLFTVIAAHPIGAIVTAIGALVLAGTQLASMYINAANSTQKAVQMGQEMLEHHKKEANAIREAIRLNKDHLETETNTYKTREEMLRKFMQLQQTIKFQEKQLNAQSLKEAAQHTEQMSKAEKDRMEKKNKLLEDIFAREKLLSDQNIQDRLAKLDIQHQEELKKLVEFGAVKAEQERVEHLQTLERKALTDQLVQEKALHQQELMFQIDSALSQSTESRLNEQLAKTTQHYGQLQARLTIWHVTESALKRVQGQSTEQIDKDFFRKSLALKESEEKVKREIIKTALRGTLADTVENLRELSKQSGTAFEAFKALSIVQTIISTYEGAQNAFTSLSKIPLVGPALGAAAAAVAFAAGFARVAAIRAQTRPTFHEGGLIEGAGDIPINAQAGEFIMRREVVPQALPVLRAINEGTGLAQTVTITFNNYGDIHTKADENELFRDFGNRIREAIRAEA